MGEEQHVRLEFAASVALDAQRVMRFVQELKEVPEEAWCEVQNLSAKPSRAKGDAATNSSIVTTVQMTCDPRVADYLCQRFSTQVRHVSQGELMLVRCSRVHLRSLPSSTITQRAHTNSKQNHITTYDQDNAIDKVNGQRPPALSRSTVADLLDCLGDQIADVFEAFQAHAQHDGSNPRLSMIGLASAIDHLRTSRVKQVPAPTSGDSKRLPSTSKTSDHVALHSVRHLLLEMISHDALSLSRLPENNLQPFMSYTDFIAVYVASLRTPIQRTLDSQTKGKLVQSVVR